METSIILTVSITAFIIVVLPLILLFDWRRRHQIGGPPNSDFVLVRMRRERYVFFSRSFWGSQS